MNNEQGDPEVDELAEEMAEDYDPLCSLCTKDHHSNHAEHTGAPSIGDLIDRALEEARDRGDVV